MNASRCYASAFMRSIWRASAQQPRRTLSSHSLPPSLRILFCGSDAFSVSALERLATARLQRNALIESINVVCKKGKPFGRGLRHIRQVPVKSAAEKLSLPLHEIDTFTGWTPPAPLDLIIAVSFGLKVPPRLLNCARYGGVNLHPSLLPDLRGPAPLQHTLLEGRTSSGITLQTLHPEHFDQGSVLAQSSFSLPKNGLCTFAELREFVAPLAADLLLNSLRDGSFASKGKPQHYEDKHGLVHAAKIRPEDSHVQWDRWTADRIMRSQRALGTLWNVFTSRQGHSPRRIQWHDLQRVDGAKIIDTLRVGVPAVRHGATAKATSENHSAQDEKCVVVRTCDGECLTPSSITIEGKPRCLQPVQVINELPPLELS